MKIPKISIITVGMNHLQYLKDLLPSVYSDSLVDANELEMIYVDNCSVDGSVEYIQESFPQVSII